MMHINTILHPTDFSDIADQALQVARSLARDHGAKLVLINVPPAPPPMEHYVPQAEFAGWVEEAERQLDRLAHSITDVPVELCVHTGDPGAAILEAADQHHAELIVMGTHGRRGFTRLLMGSVAEHVVRNAHCPVLTIKPGVGELLLHEEEPAVGNHEFVPAHA